MSLKPSAHPMPRAPWALPTARIHYLLSCRVTESSAQTVRLPALPVDSIPKPRFWPTKPVRSRLMQSAYRRNRFHDDNGRIDRRLPLGSRPLAVNNLAASHRGF